MEPQLRIERGTPGITSERHRSAGHVSPSPRCRRAGKVDGRCVLVATCDILHSDILHCFTFFNYDCSVHNI